MVLETKEAEAPRRPSDGVKERQAQQSEHDTRRSQSGGSRGAGVGWAGRGVVLKALVGMMLCAGVGAALRGQPGLGRGYQCPHLPLLPPTDPLRPIKLKMIPRNVTMGRGATLPLGGPANSARSPSVPCAPPPAASRPTHTAVIHSGGGHTLLRGTPAFQQPPSSFSSVALRYGRRCSSPQTPQLTGCAPCTAAPRSAQTSPSGPRSPRLTSSSSDPWSALISKNHRAQSVGGTIPPGEMDWLPAPSPCSRKSSWSSVSTDNDSVPCW